MFNSNLEIYNSSFNHQLQEIIKAIEIFYINYKYKYRTNDSGTLNFLKPYTASSSVFREDILDEAKNILEDLKYNPPTDLDTLKEYFKNKIYRLKKSNYHNPPHSLLRLIENIALKLDTADFNTYMGHCS